jgi:hypothetical protein
MVLDVVKTVLVGKPSCRKNQGLRAEEVIFFFLSNKGNFRYEVSPSDRDH